MIMMTYTPEYYLKYMEQCGLVKSRVPLCVYIGDRRCDIRRRLERLSSAVKKRMPGLVIRPADMKNFRRELECGEGHL